MEHLASYSDQSLAGRVTSVMVTCEIVLIVTTSDDSMNEDHCDDMDGD